MKLFESLVSTAPGAFRARCNLTEHRWERRLTDEERVEAKAHNYPRVFVKLDSEKVDPEKRQHGRWEVCFPACGGFETDDPAAFTQHMLEEHHRKVGAYLAGYNEALVRSTRAGWRSPGLKPDGQPLAKASAALTRQCATCGLVAEIHGNTGELWWAEHTRGCSLAVAS